jgi:hypothetical protein
MGTSCCRTSFAPIVWHDLAIDIQKTFLDKGDFHSSLFWSLVRLVHIAAGASTAKVEHVSAIAASRKWNEVINVNLQAKRSRKNRLPLLPATVNARAPISSQNQLAYLSRYVVTLFGWH